MFWNSWLNLSLRSVLVNPLHHSFDSPRELLPNFEAFYNIPVSKKFHLTPIVQVISNAGNQRSNETIVTGTLRGVFSF
jgi:hypothetical protein